MNVKYEAFKRTLTLMMISTIVSAVFISLIMFVPPKYLTILFVVTVIGWLSYVFYSIVLDQVKSEVKLKEMKEQLDTK